MRTLGVVLGAVVLAGLVVLAVAGVSAATAILVTAVAIVVMIVLGNVLGGRHTPNRAPYRPEQAATGRPGAPGEEEGPGSGSQRGGA